MYAQVLEQKENKSRESTSSVVQNKDNAKHNPDFYHTRNIGMHRGLHVIHQAYKWEQPIQKKALTEFTNRVALKKEGIELYEHSFIDDDPQATLGDAIWFLTNEFGEMMAAVKNQLPVGNKIPYGEGNEQLTENEVKLSIRFNTADEQINTLTLRWSNMHESPSYLTGVQIKKGDKVIKAFMEIDRGLDEDDIKAAEFNNNLAEFSYGTHHDISHPNNSVAPDGDIIGSSEIFNEDQIENRKGLFGYDDGLYKQHGELFDGIAKIAGEGARWNVVNNYQDRLTNSSRLYVAGDPYLGEDNVMVNPIHYVTFKRLWLNWKGVFNSNYDISNEVVIDKLKNSNNWAGVSSEPEPSLGNDNQAHKVKEADFKVNARDVDLAED